MDLHSHMCEGYYYQRDSFSRKVDYRNILGTCCRGVTLTQRSLICMRPLPRSWSSVKVAASVFTQIQSDTELPVSQETTEISVVHFSEKVHAQR